MSQQYQIGSYRETYRSFKLEVPERYNWAYEVFDHWARDPRKVAMVWAGDDGSTREVTFREMSEGSTRIANALAGIGARPGDKVLTMLPRVVEWWELVLGCMRAQLVPVPVTTLLTESDLTYRINASESSIVVTDPENVDKIEAVRPQCPSIEHVVVVGGATPPHLGYADLVKQASPHLPNPNNLSSRPAQHILYVWDHRLPQDGRQHPRLLPNCAYRDGQVLAGQPSNRPALDARGHRLGAGVVDLLLRAMEYGGGAVRL